MSTPTHIEILYSPGFGAGWSTWTHILTPDQTYRMIAHPTIVAMAKKEIPFDKDQILSTIFEDEPIESFFMGGWEDIRVRALPVGTVFRINEYDGSESIEIYNPAHYMTARPCPGGHP